jgi:hypothetical protein
VIGHTNPTGNGFKGLLSYLETGRDGTQRPEERVAWMEFQNLPTRNAQVAACMMRATADASVSGSKKPLYHFSVSLAPDDPADRATLRRVADRTLRDLGLADYEAVVVAHKDRAHQHLHFVVNRVHPERRTLWSPWRDRYKLESSLRSQERELGLQVVPGHLEPVYVRDIPELLAQGRDPNERVRPRSGPVRGDAAFLKDVQARASPVLEGARSWAEAQRGLADQGLSLVAKGGGFRLTDGKRDVKASQVAHGFSRYHLEQRFGPYPDYLARLAVADSIRKPEPPQLAPAPPQQAQAPAEALAEPTRAPEPAPSPAQAPPSPQPPLQPEPQRQAEAQPAPEPKQPPQPKQAPPAEQLALPLETRREAPPAPQTPQQIELLLPPEPQARRSAPAPVPAPNRKRAPEPPEDVPLPPEPTPPPPMPRRPGPAVPPTPQPARAPVRGQPGTYGATVRDYYHATRELFADPDAARREFLRAADWRDPASAAATLRDRPEHFGALRPGATHALAAHAAEVGYDYACGQKKRIRPQLKAIAEPIREAAAAFGSLDAVQAAQREVHAREQGVAQLPPLRERGNEAVARLARRLGEVYVDRNAAIAALEEHRKRFGMGQTAEVLEKTPERFGKLKPRKAPGWGGLVPWPSRAAARDAASGLGAEYRETVRAFDAIPTRLTERLAAERLTEARKARDAAQAVRDRFRDVNVTALLREAGSRLRAASGGVPARQELIAGRLRTMLPASGVDLIRSALRIAREIDHEHDRGRDRGLSL